MLSLPLEGPKSYDRTTIWRQKSVFKCKSGSYEKLYCTNFRGIDFMPFTYFCAFFANQTVIVKERADLQTCTISRGDHDLFFYIKKAAAALAFFARNWFQPF